MKKFLISILASALSITAARAEVVEILTLNLAKGVSYEQFEPVQKAVGEQYAAKQAGFISRQSLRGENGQWAVIVRWQDEHSA